MRVRLRRWSGLDDRYGGELVQPAPLTPVRDGIIIHCTIVDPPSTAGRKVELHIAGDEITEVLAWMRSEAIRARI